MPCPKRGVCLVFPGADPEFLRGGARKSVNHALFCAHALTAEKPSAPETECSAPMKRSCLAVTTNAPMALSAIRYCTTAEFATAYKQLKHCTWPDFLRFSERGGLRGESDDERFDTSIPSHAYISAQHAKPFRASLSAQLR